MARLGKNGEPSGSAGFSYRLEGIQIKACRKEAPPVGIGESYKKKRNSNIYNMKRK